jgi:TPR repeat protein
MYAHGQGVEADAAKAAEWIGKAAAQGNTLALKWLREHSVSDQ